MPSIFTRPIVKITFIVINLFLPTKSILGQFFYRNVLSNELEIKMPIDFKLIQSFAQDGKYPLANQPSEVYGNEQNTVNIAFKITKRKLDEKDVIKEGKILEEQLAKDKNIRIIDSEVPIINGISSYIFSFYSDAKDTKVYNLIFIFSSKGRMVVGNFNCVIALQMNWQSSAFMIIHSLKRV